MLAKQANDPRNPAQFIITTFHPQIIHETDKVYGVSHQNRISRCWLIPADFMLLMLSTACLTSGPQEFVYAAGQQCMCDDAKCHPYVQLCALCCSITSFLVAAGLMS